MVTKGCILTINFVPLSIHWLTKNTLPCTEVCSQQPWKFLLLLERNDPLCQDPNTTLEADRLVGHTEVEFLSTFWGVIVNHFHSKYKKNGGDMSGEEKYWHDGDANMAAKGKHCWTWEIHHIELDHNAFQTQILLPQRIWPQGEGGRGGAQNQIFGNADYSDVVTLNSHTSFQ